MKAACDYCGFKISDPAYLRIAELIARNRSLESTIELLTERNRKAYVTGYHAAESYLSQSVRFLLTRKRAPDAPSQSETVYRLQQVVKNGAEEIKALKAEVTMLKRKIAQMGGPYWGGP